MKEVKNLYIEYYKMLMKYTEKYTNEWKDIPYSWIRIIHIIKIAILPKKVYRFNLISQFSCSVMSDPLWPHGLQHTRLPCSSPTPRTYSNSCPLSWWCFPTISSSVIPFSSHLQSFPASGSFQMSQFFASGDQSTGASASASVFPMNIQDWFPLGVTGWIFLLSKRLSRFLQYHSSKASILWHSALYTVQLTHPYMTMEKP